MWDAYKGTNNFYLVNPYNMHYEKYWKLETIEDLIRQYNYVGYHDICNYPTTSDIQHYIFGSAKGFAYIYPGFALRNQTGIVNSQCH